MRNTLLFGILCVVLLCACGGADTEGSARRSSDSAYPVAGSTGAGIAGAGGSTFNGEAGDGTVGTRDDALRVQVQDTGGLQIEIITLQCAGSCADIEAVAHGGNPPYAFRWEDGSTATNRRVCLDASETIAVSVTDTAIPSDEFRYDAQTATAEVDATVIDCPGPTGTICVDNPSFEGPAPGVSETVGFNAPPWQKCTPTPDILNEGPVPDGNTYLRLGGNDTMSETVSQLLCEPMIAGTTYSLTMQLASQEVIGGPPSFEIWGSNEACGQSELLWASAPATATWTEHCASLTPSQDTTHITLFARSSMIQVAIAIIDDFRPVDACP